MSLKLSGSANIDSVDIKIRQNLVRNGAFVDASEWTITDATRWRIQDGFVERYVTGPIAGIVTQSLPDMVAGRTYQIIATFDSIISGIAISIDSDVVLPFRVLESLVDGRFKSTFVAPDGATFDIRISAGLGPTSLGRVTDIQLYDITE